MHIYSIYCMYGICVCIHTCTNEYNTDWCWIASSILINNVIDDHHRPSGSVGCVRSFHWGQSTSSPWGHHRYGCNVPLQRASRPFGIGHCSTWSDHSPVNDWACVLVYSVLYFCCRSSDELRCLHWLTLFQDVFKSEWKETLWCCCTVYPTLIFISRYSKCKVSN